MQKANVKILSENLPRISSSGKLNLTCQGLGDRDASAVPGARKEDSATQQNAVVTMMQCSSTHVHACTHVVSNIILQASAVGMALAYYVVSAGQFKCDCKYII